MLRHVSPPPQVSLHSLKSRSPHLSSLRQWFEERFKEGSPEFLAAQQNFVESMAAYSIVTYFLQVGGAASMQILFTPSPPTSSR